MKDSGMAYVHTQCSGMGNGIAGELAKLCGEAGRYGGTLACSTEPTGLDDTLAYNMEYSEMAYVVHWYT